MKSRESTRIFEIRFAGRSLRSSLSSPQMLRDARGKPFVLEAVGEELRFRPLFGSGVSKGAKVPSEGKSAVFPAWPGSRPLRVHALHPREAAFREKSASVGVGAWVAYRISGERILETRSVASADACPKAPDWRVVAVRVPEMPAAPKERARDAFTGFSLRIVGGTLAALLLIVLIPKSEPPKEELVPAQFAKLILKPRAPAAAPQPKSATRATAQQLTKAVSSRSFQKSFQKLVKGGGFTNMSAFQGFQALKGASFGPGSGGGLKGSLDRAIASVGKGGGVASLGGSNTGYAGAQSGGVSGQGSSFVALDTQGSNVEEGLTRDEVGRVIHAHLSEIRYCYESAMLSSPDLEGKIILDFTIHGGGGVKTARAKESNIDKRVQDCVIRRLVTWKFPNPRGGVLVAVTYPFLFKSVKR